MADYTCETPKPFFVFSSFYSFLSSYGQFLRILGFWAARFSALPRSRADDLQRPVATSTKRSFGAGSFWRAKHSLRKWHRQANRTRREPNNEAHSNRQRIAPRQLALGAREGFFLTRFFASQQQTRWSTELAGLFRTLWDHPALEPCLFSFASKTRRAFPSLYDLFPGALSCSASNRYIFGAVVAKQAVFRPSVQTFPDEKKLI